MQSRKNLPACVYHCCTQSSSCHVSLLKSTHSDTLNLHSGENKTIENKTSENKTIENKTIENKTIENKTIENKTIENKTIEWNHKKERNNPSENGDTA